MTKTHQQQHQPQPQQHQKHQQITNTSVATTFLSGTAGGIAQVLVGHPFDTLKVRLQTQNAGGYVYRGAIDCLVKTVRHERIAGLYKGVTSPILGIGFCNAILFTANGQFRRLLKVSETGNPPIGKITMAGAMAGAIMSLVNCPIELLKVRLQIQDPSRPRLYSNIFDCAWKTVQGNGPSGLYRGYTATFLRDVPSFAAYFGVYEWIKSILLSTSDIRHSQPGSLHPLHALLAGGIAGIVAWLPCYPQDVIKSRIQAMNSSHSTSTWSSFKSLLAEGGWKSLFRGFTPTMARAFPANAATFLAYELTRAACTPT